ncbi:anthrax toxin-like adenylyl cyclase domain-containing protein [uncultured Endozoicomonas sp.]|uniref:anthrax toxin-like adenylyl cyclase domain-containing protein n=1 Tax=uncultured Endozoicomonas sp. TaxID=432652 RepID=UPI002614A6A4|nr:anthrax toxin-like adenylyl cyclase domain-containing protein [uncultured Endozoicomonas sp.]
MNNVSVFSDCANTSHSLLLPPKKLPKYLFRSVSKSGSSLPTVKEEFELDLSSYKSARQDDKKRNIKKPPETKPRRPSLRELPDLDSNVFVVQDERHMHHVPSPPVVTGHHFFKKAVTTVVSANHFIKLLKHESSLLVKHILFGLDAVARYENQGIPRNYLEKIQEEVDELNIILGLRPFESICKPLLFEGFASKGLNIKTKSSNWGPMAGLIPVDQNFSKLAGNVTKVTAFNALSKQLVNSGIVKVEQLEISDQRREELSRLGFLIDIVEIDAIPNFKKGLKFNSRSPAGEQVTFEAFQNSEGNWVVYSGSGESRHKLDVINVIADFDILFIHAHYDDVDFSKEDKVLAADDEMGVVSLRKKRVIQALNQKLDRGEGKNMFHHGADTENPATELDADLPATIFIAKQWQSAMGIYQQSPLLIKTKEELKKFYLTMENAGFRVDVNPLWKELKGVATAVINDRKQKFEHSGSPLT